MGSGGVLNSLAVWPLCNSLSIAVETAFERADLLLRMGAVKHLRKPWHKEISNIIGGNHQAKKRVGTLSSKTLLLMWPCGKDAEGCDCPQMWILRQLGRLHESLLKLRQNWLDRSAQWGQERAACWALGGRGQNVQQKKEGMVEDQEVVERSQGKRTGQGSF